MNIVHVASMNMTRAHGMRYSIPGLVSAQNKINGINSHLVNLGNPNNLNENDYLNYDFPFYKNKKDYIDDNINPDIIIYQGVYIKEFLSFYKLYKKVPYILVPRSSFTREAQNQKKIKKIIGNKFIFKNFFENATSIHFLNEEEKEKSIDFSLPSFISGNGTEIDVLRSLEKSKEDVIRLTFIGRYDINHKGLDLLVEAVKMIDEELVKKNVVINLYGTDYNNNKKLIIEKVQELNLDNIIKVNPAIYGIEKREILGNTDLFLATSRFEGHPQSVIEAMAYGIPCILTPGTNMQRISEKYNASWNVGQNANSIAEGILESLKNLNELKLKGENARELAVENYSWSKVAHETIKAYRKYL